MLHATQRLPCCTSTSPASYYTPGRLDAAGRRPWTEASPSGTRVGRGCLYLCPRDAGGHGRDAGPWPWRAAYARSFANPRTNQTAPRPAHARCSTAAVWRGGGERCPPPPSSPLCAADKSNRLLPSEGPTRPSGPYPPSLLGTGAAYRHTVLTDACLHVPRGVGPGRVSEAYTPSLPPAPCSSLSTPSLSALAAASCAEG